MPSHDAGTLVYCGACGAPQVRLSEELRQQAEAEALESAATPKAASHSGRSWVWRDAIRFVGLAALVAGGLSLVSLVAAPVLLLAWLWATASPIAVLALFHARSPQVPISTSFGARVGLLCGVTTGFAMLFVDTLGLFLARRLHALGEFDKQMAIVFDQVRANAQAQYGSSADSVTSFTFVPEFHATMFLLLFLGAAMLLIVVTTTLGAFAGSLRAKRG